MPIDTGMYYYTEAIKQAEEDRMYLIWALGITSPYKTEDFPSTFSEMRGLKPNKSKKKKGLGMQI